MNPNIKRNLAGEISGQHMNDIDTEHERIKTLICTLYVSDMCVGAIVFDSLSRIVPDVCLDLLLHRSLFHTVHKVND
jgi:hypothetical protein